METGNSVDVSSLSKDTEVKSGDSFLELVQGHSQQIENAMEHPLMVFQLCHLQLIFIRRTIMTRKTNLVKIWFLQRDQVL